jgi:large subunit ribosomal protein L5
MTDKEKKEKKKKAAPEGPEGPKGKSKPEPTVEAKAEAKHTTEGKAGAPEGDKKAKKEKKKKGAETAASEAAVEAAAAAPPVKPRLKERYRAEVRATLMKQFGIQNPMAVPGLCKVVINMGCKGAVETKARIDAAVRDLAVISGQRPTVRKARKSIASFKLREGMPIGVAVTLRGNRMWEFADRLISVVLPRIRDFRGVKTKLDGRGNYTLGLSEQAVFPEIDFDKLEYVQGMDVTFVTSASNDEQGYFLLKELGIPFRTEGQD